MSNESFDPSKYKNIAEMPKEEQENFATVPGEPNSFVARSALEIQERVEEDVKKINELRSGIDKLFGKNKKNSTDILRQLGAQEDLNFPQKPAEIELHKSLTIMPMESLITLMKDYATQPATVSRDYYDGPVSAARAIRLIQREVERRKSLVS